MLHPERIPLNEAETAAVDKLIGEGTDMGVSMTRRDPGNTGPLLIHVGNDIYEIDDSGHRKKHRKAAN